jgi:S-adenosylmethionine:tRNA ribosyltransferase-isomerase
MQLEDFNYNLPKELIAQHPVDKRTQARMLVLKKENKKIEHKIFADFINFVKAGDTIVLNDTKVIPVRLLCKRKTGANIEIFLLKPLFDKKWNCLIKNSRRLKAGEIIEVGQELNAKIVDKTTVELIYEGNIYDVLNKTGKIPLPPYISREATEEDKNSYQTVFAKNPGSAAAPTAGLHFDEKMLAELKNKGVNIAYITLTVGLGTFLPVKCENILEHKMHHESFAITADAAKTINETKGSVIAVGTTCVRTLEAVAQKYGKIVPVEDETNIFIYPPFEFKVVNKLLTNFHLPKSTLIMLVSAFAGREFVLEAYKNAVSEEYRFFSYGDCMFIE